MHTTLLNEEQFVATLGNMQDVTFGTGDVFDVWPYIEVLVTDGLVLPLVHENRLVEKVYRNLHQSIDHILLPTQKKNVFVVIVVDVAGNKIIGHHLLDLSAQF